MTRPDDDGVTPVTERTVMNHWLALEAAKSGDDLSPEAVSSLADDAMQDALLERKPGAAAIFHEAPGTRWYRLRIRATELRRLLYISGPKNQLWGALAEDRRLVEGARRVRSADPDVLTSKTDVDVAHVLAVRDRIANGESIPAPVLATRHGRTPTWVLDGNHRLTAVAANRLETDPDGGLDVDASDGDLEAFLGVRPNPVATPVVERVRGLVDRFLGRRRF